MWRRYLVPLLLVCASMFLLGSLAGAATAQDVAPGCPWRLEDATRAGWDATPARRDASMVKIDRYGADHGRVAGVAARCRPARNLQEALVQLRFGWNFVARASITPQYDTKRFLWPGIYAVTFPVAAFAPSRLNPDPAVPLATAPAADESRVEHANRHGMVRLATIDLNRLKLTLDGV